ncbi:MAG: hypothetical protein HYY17_04930 [Planctomycetes bacterium]|nr:hypothetical protein [Planctomycetota bacterium]
MRRWRWKVAEPKAPAAIDRACEIPPAAIPKAAEERGAIGEAMAFLRAALAHGPRPAGDVQKEARARGVSKKTLERAKHRLRVRSDKGAFAGAWTWTLPEDRQQAAPVPAVGDLRPAERQAEPLTWAELELTLPEDE